MIYNDISLLKLGIVNILEGQWLKAAGMMLIILSACFVLIWLMRRMILILHGIRWSRYSLSFIVILFILILVNSVKSGFTYTSDKAFQETFALIGSNIIRSAEARNDLKHFSVDRINRKLDYQRFSLKSKPDIYLIFVESYGRLLYDNTFLRASYFKCLDSCESVLLRNGLALSTGFSTPPVSGGQSWLSYTSVLFGYNIRNQGTFNSLLKNPEMSRYHSFFRILNLNGYKTYRLNAMPQASHLEVPWNIYSGFYSIDQWINFSDLKYTGRLYGFGPSPPDQYSINFAGRFIKNDNEGPFAMFFITQTTHNPFYNPGHIVPDWQSLNLQPDNASLHASVFLRKPLITDYAKAIQYDLSVLVQFITSVRDSNAVFILIGDHQPPILTGSDDGFETPVHIISRNSAFSDAFRRFGFKEGMKADEQAVPIRHEGIYSMFMREFIRFFGEDNSDLPEYLPYGIKTNEL
jgi:hypothetical protein